jgi:hypothetical protein
MAFITTKSGEIYARSYTMDNYMKQYYFRYMDVNIFLFDLINDNFVPFLSALARAPVKSTIILLKADWTALQEQGIINKLTKFAHDSIFYLSVPSISVITWYQVITMRSGYSMKELSFLPDSYQFVEDYDLNGLTIYSISDSWAPFLTLANCNENGTICDNYGYLKEYTDVIPKQANFTYESHRQMNGDWGTVPKSGLRQ